VQPRWPPPKPRASPAPKTPSCRKNRSRPRRTRGRRLRAVRQARLRDEIESARREREQIIDHINLDQVTFSGFSEQAEAQAKAVIQTFADYIASTRTRSPRWTFSTSSPTSAGRSPSR
jgi:hypothetical protein